jgi:two-component system, LytTR family, response regulator
MIEKLKALLIDDSEQALRLLQLMLEELAPEIKIVAISKNVEDGLKAIEKYKPDALFLDIEMPKKSGLQLAEILLNNESDCEIIFTTAYNQYAIQAFRLSAVDYLLKPIDENQLIQAVEKIKENRRLKSDRNRLSSLMKNLNRTTEKTLTIPIFNGFEYLSLKEIEYLEADGSYVHILMINGKQKTASKNLKYFEQTLENQSNFIRVHRSYIINIDNMRLFSKAGRGRLTMKNGKEIDLARDRRQAFFDLLKI